jgi:predicted phosphodiesterase
MMTKPKRDALIEWAVLLFLSLLGVYIAAALFSATAFVVSAFEFTVELVPFQRGETVVFIPPIGELSAVTHWFPFTLRVTLQNVDLEYLASGLENLAETQNFSFFEVQLKSKLLFFLARSAVISFICGAGTVFLLARNRKGRCVLLGGLMAALLFLALFAATVIYPYDLNAFESPRYKGILGAAPWVVGLADQALSTLKALGEQLEVMTANLHDLARQLEQVHPMASENTLRVLHVSDIHNNPAAFDFIEKVVSSFKIDLVIDTGDFTDYGTELESELVSRVTSLPVPYIFIPGNHDSPQVIEAMRRGGVLVLDHAIIELEGLRIAGIADPASQVQLMEVAPEGVLRQAAEDAFKLFENETHWPDLLGVHHPIMGELFVGKVPVILSGHNHRAGIAFDQGSALINAGTTGAAGMRGLNAPAENPYSLVVLYFNRSPEGRQALVMADLISVQQFQDSFMLQRHYKR